MRDGRHFRNRDSLTGISLVVLVTWAVLCVIWNMYGAIQLSAGGRALGRDHEHPCQLCRSLSYPKSTLVTPASLVRMGH